MHDSSQRSRRTQSARRVPQVVRCTERPHRCPNRNVLVPKLFLYSVHVSAAQPRKKRASLTRFGASIEEFGESFPWSYWTWPNPINVRTLPLPSLPSTRHHHLHMPLFFNKISKARFREDLRGGFPRLAQNVEACCCPSLATMSSE